jgi:hypothetical protein
MSTSCLDPSCWSVHSYVANLIQPIVAIWSPVSEQQNAQSGSSVDDLTDHSISIAW